jgi:coenzyme F420-reducing hydrogenase delta subunit
MKKARQNPTPRAAVVAVPAWGPVPSASSDLPTTILTASVPWSRLWGSRLKTTIPNRPIEFWAWSAKTMPTRHWIWPVSTGLSYSADVRLIPIRCLGSMNVIWIKDALSQGMDGVFLLGCKHGDDYQCHFVKGSELADIRMKKIGDALASLALETNVWPSLKWPSTTTTRFRRSSMISWNPSRRLDRTRSRVSNS